MYPILATEKTMKKSFAVKILRKWTSPVHYIYGLLCAFFVYAFGLGFGSFMMLLFAAVELWEDYCLKDRREGYKLEGADDWWEAFLFFVIGVSIIGLLKVIGVIESLGWF